MTAVMKSIFLISEAIMAWRRNLAWMLAASAWQAGAVAQTAPATTDQLARTRGALLYETHCGTCHGKELHWRDKRLAKDWASLSNQVRRWQDNAGLNWSGEDIGAVAEYLNERIYRLGTRD